ncbi:MAG: hypothetical protein CL401_02740 [Acidiferrobacteraceae bacterium]|nr:hypothetical protein [Acidiferrobacteraceae bacterium]
MASSRKSTAVRLKYPGAGVVWRNAFVQRRPIGVFLSCLLFFCSAQVIAETERRLGEVANFVDGDTLILESGEAIRLVGINTPEMARDGRPAEPLALEARDTLVALLADGQVLIEVAEQPLDRHGRTLAHLFRPDGIHVQEVLLRKGLASAVAIAPNDRYLDLFFEAESAAHHAGRGLWALNYYVPKAEDEVSAGYQFVQARLSRIEMGKKWFSFSAGKSLTILVRRSDWVSRFDYSPAALDQASIALRGWFSKKKTRATLVINHPFMLERCGISPLRLCAGD